MIDEEEIWAELVADIVEPSLGGEEPDGLLFEYLSFEPGEYELGTGNNATYYGDDENAGCEQCLFVDVDYNDEGLPAASYFAESGTINIAIDPGLAWKKVTVTLNNVTLRRWEGNKEEQLGWFVEDGDCISLDKELVFEYVEE